MGTTLRLLVCGSRDWTDAGSVFFEIGRLVGFAPAVVMHGGCPTGADAIVDGCARGLRGVVSDVLVFAVDRAFDGPWPSAGPRRNSRMLRDGRPTQGLAFGALWKPRQRGKSAERTGTGDMVKKMIDAGIPVRWLEHPAAVAVDLAAFPTAPQ